VILKKEEGGRVSAQRLRTERGVHFFLFTNWGRGPCIYSTSLRRKNGELLLCKREGILGLFAREEQDLNARGKKGYPEKIRGDERC